MKVVTYKRVSTEKQGKSGLGLEAQQEYINTVVASHDLEVVGTFTDSGISGSLAPMERDGLKEALALCKATGAWLLVAKLDRLSRDVEHIAGLIKIVCIKVATMMQADTFQLHLFAALAEQEKAFIQSRTKAALASLKARAVAGDAVAIEKVQKWKDNAAVNNEIGKNRKASLAVRQAKASVFASSVEDNILAAQQRGLKTLLSIAEHLNSKGITTIRGAQWTSIAVSRILKKMESSSM